MRRLALLFFNLLAPLAALGVVAAFLFSPRRGVLKSLHQELRERFGAIPPDLLAQLSGRHVLWIHAASAGEVGAVEGLVRRLRQMPGAPAVLMTCTTAAGREHARRLGFADACVLAPLDCILTVRRFLAAARPYGLVLVETELWPNMIEEAARMGVKIGLVNGRLSERSFGRYRLIGGLLRGFLERLDRLAVQSELDAQRFLALGARPEATLVVGNMKFDRLKCAADPRAAERLTSLGWTGAPLFVAGSTHPVEEELVVEAFAKARLAVPGLKLILAPRHVERAGGAAETLEQHGIRYCLWSRSPEPGCDCLVLDTLGVLASFYGHAAVSFVGGTLVPVGGHNLLEPALSGSPALFGPHTFHTRHTAEILVSSGCGFVILGAAELAAKVQDMLSDPARAAAQGRQARALAEGLQGATDRSLKHLTFVLTPPSEMLQ